MPHVYAIYRHDGDYGGLHRPADAVDVDPKTTLEIMVADASVTTSVHTRVRSFGDIEQAIGALVVLRCANPASTYRLVRTWVEPVAADVAGGVDVVDALIRL